MTARKTKRGAKPGAEHPRARFTEAQVLKIRELAAAGASYRDLAAKYETGKTTIEHIVRGERYADVGGPIRRLDAEHGMSGGGDWRSER